MYSQIIHDLMHAYWIQQIKNIQNVHWEILYIEFMQIKNEGEIFVVKCSKKHVYIYTVNKLR